MSEVKSGITVEGMRGKEFMQEGGYGTLYFDIGSPDAHYEEKDGLEALDSRAGGELPHALAVQSRAASQDASSTGLGFDSGDGLDSRDGELDMLKGVVVDCGDGGEGRAPPHTRSRAGEVGELAGCPRGEALAPPAPALAPGGGAGR